MDDVDGMRWLVGMDARELSGGAAVFGRWLGASGRHAIYGLHVIEWTPGIEDGVQPRSADTSEWKTSDALQPLSDAPGVEAVEAVQARSVEDGLVKGLIWARAQTLILGRRAPMSGSVGAIRLGREARRIVRDPPCAVVVVPPDYEAVPGGPVVVATDMTETCGDAVRWASALAVSMERPLTLVYVEPPPDKQAYLPVPDVDGDQEADPFAAWARRHDVPDADRVRLEGDAVGALLSVAAERDAAMIVTGSRCLDGVARLFLSSLGTELAATAPLPVAIVPPGRDG